mmetsp:Transcript_46605/g.108633  ORF Transcript_46605/g.108633 Transcript_46605/m.108633 type:complete len:105 (-) Transcript_46605:2-316(-)
MSATTCMKQDRAFTRRVSFGGIDVIEVTCISVEAEEAETKNYDTSELASGEGACVSKEAVGKGDEEGEEFDDEWIVAFQARRDARKDRYAVAACRSGCLRTLES